MLQRDEQRLIKVLEYCERIHRTVERYGQSLNIFENDDDYQQSVSFSILQIGELVAGLSESYRNETASEMPWAQIKGMRNIVVHGYGSIELKVVWKTVLEDIPELEVFCRKQLSGA